MNSPFRCGPNPCEWRCGPTVIPTVGCEFCTNSTGPENWLVTIPTIVNAQCSACASYAGSYLTPWANEAVLDCCTWRLTVADDPCNPGFPYRVEAGVCFNISFRAYLEVRLISDLPVAGDPILRWRSPTPGPELIDCMTVQNEQLTAVPPEYGTIADRPCDITGTIATISLPS